MTHAPIGSSSGLLNSIEAAPHAPSRRVREWLAPVTGLSTSLLLHGAILTMGILLLREVPRFLPEKTLDQPVINPGMQITDSPNSLAASPLERGRNPLDKERASLGVSDGSFDPAAGKNAFDDATGATKLDPSTLTISQSNTAITGIQGISGPNKGTGLPFGRPDGVVKPQINFIPGDPAGGPAASRVVFLCDATGTMTGLKFQLLKRELNATVAKLDPVQNFNIVLFADETASALSKTLLPGTPASKQKAGQFLEKFATRGATNPLPGIELAFGMKPEVIFLLSDGEFDNIVAYADVIAKINALNPGKKVKVYTILFGDRDERAQQTLQTIASDNGGTFRFVSPEDLLKR